MLHDDDDKTAGGNSPHRSAAEQKMIDAKSQEYHRLIDSNDYDKEITADDVDHFVQESVEFASKRTGVDATHLQSEEVILQGRMLYGTSLLRDETPKQSLKLAADKALHFANMLADIAREQLS